MSDIPIDDEDDDLGGFVSPFGGEVGESGAPSNIGSIQQEIEPVKTNHSVETFTCPICLLPLTTTPLKPPSTLQLEELLHHTFKTYTDPCHHGFCLDCIQTWFKHQSTIGSLPTCPLCKSIITSLVLIESENDQHEPILFRRIGILERPFVDTSSNLYHPFWLVHRKRIYYANWEPVNLKDGGESNEDNARKLVFSDRTKNFVARELKVLLGNDVYESWMLDYVIQVFKQPLNAIVNTLEEQFVLSGDIARKFVKEVVRFEKSGLNVATFDETIEYEPAQWKES